MQVTIKQSSENDVPEFKGLKDGGHHHIRCSNCNAPLVDVWITRPDEDVVWSLQFNCVHCEDHSFIQTVKGGFHIGPGIEPNPAYPDDLEKAIMYTLPEIKSARTTDKNAILIETIKVKEYNE